MDQLNDLLNPTQTTGVCILDKNWRIDECNTAFSAVFNKQPHELCGAIFRDLSPSIASAAASWQKGMTANDLAPVRVKIKGMNFVLKAFHMHGAKGKACRIACVLSPVENLPTSTDKEKYLQSENRFRDLINFLPETIFELDSEGFFTYLSPNGLKTFGYSEEDLKNKIHVSEMIVQQKRRSGSKSTVSLLKNKKDKKISEFTGVRKDGSTFPIGVAGSPIKQKNKIIGVRGIVFDLTETKNVQHELEKERNILKAFLDSLPDVSFIMDENGTYLEFLSLNEQLLLRPMRQLKNKTLHEIWDKEEADRLLACIRKTIKSRQPQIIEYSMPIENKGIFWFQARTSCFYDKTRRKNLVIWTAREITELKNIQNQLEENQENLTITLESIGDAVIATDCNGVIIRMNAEAARMTEWEKEKALGRRIEEVFKLIDTAENVEIENPVYRALREGKVIELSSEVKALTKHGKCYHIADSAAPIRKKDGSLLGAIIVFHDVTDQHKKQRDLEKSESRLRRAQHVARIGDWEYTAGSDRICASAEAFNIYGYERIAPCIPIEEVLSPVHPEDAERVRQAIGLLQKGECSSSIEYRILKGSPPEVRYVRSVAKPYSDSDGRTVVLGTIQDITESKLIEDELKIRNSELNNFVYKVSHDLRAPLSSIKGLLALQKMQNHGDDINFVEMMERSVDKLDNFIRDILSHSRNLNTNPQTTEINFHRIIARCFEELAFLSNYNLIEKNVIISGETFYGDEVRLNEIFRNLISNSIKYANPSQPRKFLNITATTTHEETTISIEDNGIGIDDAIQSKVFEMFFRGNTASDGSGIGLYIVKQAIQKLNGTITLESKINQGTKFVIRLPNHPPSKGKELKQQRL